jgi:hypothetical protein
VGLSSYSGAGQPIERCFAGVGPRGGAWPIMRARPPQRTHRAVGSGPGLPIDRRSPGPCGLALPIGPDLRRERTRCAASLFASQPPLVDRAPRMRSEA